MKNHVFKTEEKPILLDAGSIYVILAQNGGDRFVLCPFESCRLGFVDILDEEVQRKSEHGVVNYCKVDSFMTSIQIAENDDMNDMEAIGIVKTALRKFDDTCCMDLEEYGKRQRGEFKHRLLSAGLVRHEVLNNSECNG